mgnify:CR=1 FL=1
MIALDYEAYPEMAEKELARIGDDATKNWPLCKWRIVHRTRSRADRRGERDHRQFQRRTATRRLPRAASPSKKLKDRADLEKEVFEGGEVWIGTQSGQPLQRSKQSVGLNLEQIFKLL